MTPKKPVKGKKRSKIVPGTSGPEQAQRQLGSRAKASISAQQSKKTSGKRNNFSYLFGNNSSVFPGHVQVNGLAMGDGSWTGLGPGWAESLLSSSWNIWADFQGPHCWGLGLIPDQGTKIPQTTWHGQIYFKKRVTYRITDLSCHPYESHVTGGKPFKFSELQIPSP